MPRKPGKETSSRAPKAGRPRAAGPALSREQKKVLVAAARAPQDAPAREARIGAAVQGLLLDRFMPASLVVNAAGLVLYQYGPVGRFLDQPRGPVTHDLLRQASGGLRTRLRAALRQALEGGAPVTSVALRRKAPGGPDRVRITVEPLQYPPEADGLLLVVLEQLAPPEQPLPGRDERLVTQLEYELREMDDELRLLAGQLAASQEAASAAGEERTGLREQLRATREELRAVTAQLEAKVAELEQSNGDLAHLVNDTEIGTLFLDSHLRVRRFTPSLTQLLRLIPADIGRPVADIRQRFDNLDLHGDARDVLQRGAPLERQVQSESGSWYLCRLLPYRTEDRVAGVVLTFVDITARRRAVSRRVADTILAITHDAVMVVRTDGRIHAASQVAADLLGIPLEVMAHRQLEDVAGGLGGGEALSAAVGAALEGAKPAAGLVLSVTSGQSPRSLLADVQPLQLDDGAPEMALVMLRDRRRQEEEDEAGRLTQANARDLFREALRLQEEERRRISRELHDQVGQYLTAIGLALKSVQGRTADDPGMTGILEHLREMTGQLSRRTHTLALELRPPELDQLGLTEALEGYLEERAERAQLRARFHAEGLGPLTLSPEMETAVFRVVQEALTNVILHAHAREVRVSLSAAEGQLIVQVEDDGEGFDPDVVLADRGPGRRLGLLGMRERIAQVGGTLAVGSIPGEGTTLRIAVPLEGEGSAGV